jgi:hypothetical protein
VVILKVALFVSVFLAVFEEVVACDFFEGSCEVVDIFVAVNIGDLGDCEVGFEQHSADRFDPRVQYFHIN